MVWSFKIVSKNFSFVWSFCRVLGKFTSLLMPVMAFYWPLLRFSPRPTTLSQFDILIYMSKYQSGFRANQQWISAIKNLCFRTKKISNEQRWFRAEYLWNGTAQSWILQLWAALIQRKSEVISSEVFHVLWNSAVQLWLFLGLQIRKLSLRWSARAFFALFCAELVALKNWLV